MYELFGSLMIIVYSCVASAPWDSYDPHQVDAARRFVTAHPDTCRADPPEPVVGPRTVEECRAWAFIRWQPGWLQKNEGRVYMTADCVLERPEPLDMEAAKRRVSP